MFPMTSSPLHELARLFRSGATTPVAVTEAILARIERLEPRLNAFITVMADEAIRAATEATREIAAGRDRGPLHGVPVAVKDLCATQGVRTTAGSARLRGWVPTSDAAVVRRLRDAGAVIVGKTHLDEWACGAAGINPHYGTARNPWNTAWISGGSSSGSAVAVAAELCFAAIGTDTGGSVRIPAALCGVYGFKPTHGTVSLDGVVPLSRSLDHVGVIARAPGDCALVLAAIADAGCTATASAPARGSLHGLRVGMLAAEVEPDAQVVAAVRDAVRTLARLGAEVRDVALPDLHELWATGNVVLLREAADYHKERLEHRPEEFGDAVRERLARGLAHSAADHARHRQLMAVARCTCDRTAFADIDVLALPTTMISAMPIESAAEIDPTFELTYLTSPFNVTGQPAISVPCGWTQQGLPLGLQLVAPRFHDAMLLGIAHTLAREIDPPRRPPIEPGDGP